MIEENKVACYLERNSKKVIKTRVIVINEE